MKTNKKSLFKALVLFSSALMTFNAWANSGNAYIDPTNPSTLEPTYYANSPIGPNTTSCYTASGSGQPTTGCNTGNAIPKFVDPLPLPRMPGGAPIPAAPGKTFFSGSNNSPPQKYIPLAIPTKWVNPMGQVSSDDYYEIAAVEYKEKMHSSLKNPTVLRGYVQIDPERTDAHAGLNNQELPILGTREIPLFEVDGKTPILVPRPDIYGVLSSSAKHIPQAGVSYALVQAYAVDNPHYFGPMFTASHNLPTRIKFINLLPVGRAAGNLRNGDIFLPVDESLSGAGFGPDKLIKYSQNRANIHLYGGDTPWISSGNPHQWITPAGESLAGQTWADAVNAYLTASTNSPISAPITMQDLATSTLTQLKDQYLRGVGASNVPDMVDPGPGAMTYYYPNGGSARLEWIQDQTFGQARLNIYAGLTSLYLLTDPADTLANAYESSQTIPVEQIPLVFQDKTFVPADIAVEDALWDKTLWGDESSLWYPHVYETNQYYFNTAVTTPKIATNKKVPTVLPTTTDNPQGNPALAYPSLYSNCSKNGSKSTWTCDYTNQSIQIAGSTQTTGPGLNPPGRWDWGPWFWPVFASAYDRLPTGGHVLSSNTVAGQPVNSGWSEVTTTYTAYLDTPVVNGQAYPTLTVDPKAYRFRMLNAGGDRFLNLGLYLAADKKTTNPIAPTDPKTQPLLCDGINAIPVTDCTEVKMVAMNSSFQNLYYNNNPKKATVDGLLDFPSASNLASLVGTSWETGGLMGTGWGDPTGQLAAGVPDPTTIGPDFYLIGNDAGYLANMVDIPSTPVNYETNKRSITVLNVLEHGLYMGPGSRADVVVDFSKYAGKTLILYNDAPSASPAGDPRLDYLTGQGSYADVGGPNNVIPGYGPNTRTIMQIVVSGAAPATPLNKTSLQNATAALFSQDQPMPIIPQPDFKAAYPTNPNISATQIMGTVMTGFVCGTTTTSACTSGAGAYQGLSFKTMQPLNYWKADNNCASLAANGNGTQNACRAAAILTPALAGATISNAFIETKTIQELFEPTFGRMNATLGLELPYTSSMIQTTIPLNYIDPITDKVQDGTTNFWRITHNGLVDHSIHFEYVNVQIINRVGWDGTWKQVPADEIGWKDTIITHPLEDIFVAVTAKAPRIPFGMETSSRPRDPSQPLNAGGSDPSLANANGQVVSGFTQVDPTSGNAASVFNQADDFAWEYDWRSAETSMVAIDMMRPFLYDYWSDKSGKSSVNKALFTNAPSAPTILGFTGTGIAWTDPTPIIGATVLNDPKNEIEFLVTVKDSLTTTPVVYHVPANQTNWVDKDLVSGHTYTFTVQARNHLGLSPASAPLTQYFDGSSVAPFLTASNATTNSVDLIWGNVNLNSTTYDVLVSTTNALTVNALTVGKLTGSGIAGASNVYTTINSAGALDIANLVYVNGLSPNSTYYAQVVDKSNLTPKNGIIPGYSNILTVITNATGAASLNATPTGPTTATLNWTIADPTHPATAGTPTLTISPGGTAVINGNSATVSALSANTTYTVTLTYKGINGLIASTNVITFTTNVAAATGLSVGTTISTNSATLTWANPVGAMGQKVLISPSNVAGQGTALINGSLATAAVVANGTSAALTNLAPNTLYTVTVQELGVNGLTTNASTTFTTTPGIVSNISFAGVANGSGKITWSLPIGGGTVKVTSSPSTNVVVTNAADNTSATVSGLVSGTIYTFSFVVNGARAGTTISQPFFAANAPTTVTVAMSSINQAVVKFSTAANLTKFAINWSSTSATGPWTTLSSVTTIAPGGLSASSVATAAGATFSNGMNYFQVVPLSASTASLPGTPSASISVALGTAPNAATLSTPVKGAKGILTLNWINNSNNVTSIDIWIKKGTAAFALDKTVAGNLGTNQDTLLTTGTTYQYYLVSRNAINNTSATSNTVTQVAP